MVQGHRCGHANDKTSGSIQSIAGLSALAEILVFAGHGYSPSAQSGLMEYKLYRGVVCRYRLEQQQKHKVSGCNFLKSNQPIFCFGTVLRAEVGAAAESRFSENSCLKMKSLYPNQHRQLQF